jgi:2,3-bisphosphoglycerate-dependent phosphoglycerate mutase
MSKSELILIRHGETVWNREGRWQGHLDSDLTTLGLRQADAIADRLASADLVALYSSDLGRAHRTAERVAARTGHRVITDTGLRERGLGIFQGLTFSEIRDQHPAEFERFSARDPDHVVPGGESLHGKHQRAVRCLERIAGSHRGQRIAVVTHGGVLDSLFRHALGLSLQRARQWVLYNGSLNTFFLEDGAWSLGTWGDVAHLQHAGTLDDY